MIVQFLGGIRFSTTGISFEAEEAKEVSKEVGKYLLTTGFFKEVEVVAGPKDNSVPDGIISMDEKHNIVTKPGDTKTEKKVMSKVRKIKEIPKEEIF